MAGERDGFGTIGSGTRRIKNNNGGGGNSGGGNGGGSEPGCWLFSAIIAVVSLSLATGVIGGLTVGVHTLLS